MAKKKETKTSKYKGVVFLPPGFSYGFEKMKNEIREKRDKINARKTNTKPKEDIGVYLLDEQG